MVDIESSSTTSGISSWVTCIERSVAASSLSVGVKQTLDDALGKNADALFNLFESGSIDKVTDRVCCHLLSLYRTRESELCHYTMELVPAMIWSYLLAVSTNMKKTASSIEACLLALYNLEVVDEKGRPKVIVTTIPSLGRASIYHEPGALGSAVLTESALSRYEQDDRKTFTGPFPVVEKFNAKNRHPVLSHLFRCYNAVVGQLSSRSHQSVCDVAIRVSCAGFSPSSAGSAQTADAASVHQLASDSSQPPASAAARKVSSYNSRIAVSSELLIELARGVYFALFNYDPALGLDALRCLHFRASRELHADAIMLIRAMINSVESSLSNAAASALLRQGQHGLRDVSSAMSASLLLTTAFGLSGGGAGTNREVITNASFRTQKLPDDIGVEPQQQQQQLTSATGTLPEMTPLSEKKALGLSGLKLGPIKSALKKKVERSVSARKDDAAAAARKDEKDSSVAAAAAAVGGFKDGREKTDGVRTPKKARAATAAAKAVADGERPAEAGSGSSAAAAATHQPPQSSSSRSSPMPSVAASSRPGSGSSTVIVTVLPPPPDGGPDSDDDSRDDDDEGVGRRAKAISAASERLGRAGGKPLTLDGVHVSWDDEDEQWALPSEEPPLPRGGGAAGQPVRSMPGGPATAFLTGGSVGFDSDATKGTAVDGSAEAAAAAATGALDPVRVSYRSSSQV